MSGIDGLSHGPPPPARHDSELGKAGANADDRLSKDQDRTGARGRERPGGELGREREGRNATAQREAFHAALAKGGAATSLEQQTAPNGENAAADKTELTLILPSATTSSQPQGSAPMPPMAPSLTSERVAALEALAMKIEGELDIALRVSARTLGGGLEVRLSLDSAKLGFSGVTVTMRGAELAVQLTGAPSITDNAIAASAQALAVSLSNRFPQRVIRVERVSGEETNELAEPATIADIFARRC